MATSQEWLKLVQERILLKIYPMFIYHFLIEKEEEVFGLSKDWVSLRFISFFLLNLHVMFMKNMC